MVITFGVYPLLGQSCPFFLSFFSTFCGAIPPYHVPWQAQLLDLSLAVMAWHFTPIPVLQAVWMVTWVAVVILSMDLGLAIGVVFSMVTVVCRTQRWE